MPRNSLPMLSRAQAASSSAPTATPPQSVPTIRFINATPSIAVDPDASFNPVAPFASSPLAPRSDVDAPRKRLVPKKSKLGLLSGSSKTKDKGTKDLSDVVRRVGGGSTNGKGGFEIYVDHADDPDIGEIVVVKKKKSRLGLDGMGWGALGEVTNVPSTSQPKEKAAPSENLLKVKGEDSLKWWSIRGRKDSKEKAKENKSKAPARSKTPEPSKPLESRARFNSLNASTLLSVPEPNQGSVRSVTNPIQSTNGLLAPPSTDEPNTGSLAVRAMRSVRSIARMKSWATLSGTTTTNTKEGNKNTLSVSTNMTTTNTNDKTKEKGEEKKKKKKKEKTEKTVRYSGSSFEAGALSPVDGTFPASGTMKKKQSILGLGLPSTMRRTVRNVSTTSSVSSGAPPPATTNRLSVDSAHLILNAAGRPSSVVSSGSSLRPPSTASGVSAFSARSPRSSSSSMVSVRWDEEVLQNVKEMQRKERRAKRESADSTAPGDKATSKESRRSSEARRRTPIADIFPETVQRPSSLVSNSTGRTSLTGPVVNIEEATSDGHSDHGEDPILATPSKKARARPVSEQLLGKTRPQCIHEESDGVISILDAATNDLASLINRLDLEATPASSIGSPLKLSPLASFDSPAKAILPRDDSPVKRRSLQKDQVFSSNGLRDSKASITSLRPYAHAQTLSKLSAGRPERTQSPARIGQQIAPWSELDWEISPKKPVVRKTAATRPTHRRTLSPTPVLDPPPVFQPLQPAKRNISPVLTKGSTPLTATPVTNETREPSSKTFGSRTSKIGVDPYLELDDEPVPSPCPVSKRNSGHVRSGSIASVLGHKQSRRSPLTSMPIAPEARKGLGLSGTLGGSASTEPPIDPEDPDSDIPDELQVIIAGQSDDECVGNLDDTLSFHRSSAPSSPARLAPNDNLPETLPAETEDRPVFRAQLIDEEANQADIDDSGNVSSEDDTSKSFDFTGELKKLNESGASDRRSFVEQLENAFRTPARVDLGLDDGFLKASAPPVPPLPLNFRKSPSDDLVPRSVSIPEATSVIEDNADIAEDLPSRNSGVSDTLEHLLAECQDDICRPYPEMRRSHSSMRSKASDGQLNTGFKFGGKPVIPAPVPEQVEKPLTLSDIIPPPSHYLPRSGSTILEDDSVFNSIMAHAAEMPRPAIRPRSNSDGSSRRAPSGEVSRVSYISSHSRITSEASFTGLESFEEIRRGFEFGPNRPTFYPPPGAANTSSRSWLSHKKFESIYSVASVSSFGSVLDSGSVDPFGYLHSRPLSDDVSVSMSMDVDDTFSFIHKGKRRQRVDSDTSSFYFRAPGISQNSWQGRRGHRRQDSTMSTYSNAPPVSIYNKSFGAHRRNDSNASASSIAHSYAMYPGGRASWARHRPDLSVDSVSSDYSALRLGRPGVGDKMFDRDYGMPLTAISASPPESVSGEPTNQPSNWDSIIDGHRTSAEDSLFEKTGYKTTYDDDESVFGFDGNNSDPGRLPSNHFRPLSMISVGSAHTAPREDDTMITMIGGLGHVRRRSVDSLIEASPLVKIGMERRKQTLQKVARVLKFDQDESMPPPPVPKLPTGDGLTKSPLAPKPSIASTSSFQFGGDRMIKARHGLLERQSLEDSALIAQGEEILTTLRSKAVFTRPGPASRSRSSTITESSGAETPPLSASDTSSISGGSQSSIDLGQLNTLLTASTRPSSGIAGARARQRARGTGHRRRISQARMSRSSVYETIHEESYVFSSSPSPEQPSLPSVPASLTKAIASPHVRDSVYIVDSDTQSLVSFSEDWDDERGIVGLRRYYTLRDEADHTVTESKRVWPDTAFSIFAVQSFQPPSDKTGMQAMLEHSKQNYGPLPSELRPYRVRSRTSSRASPYPAVRALKSTLSPDRACSQRLSRLSVTFDDFSVSKAFTSFDQDVSAPLSDVTRNVNVVSPPPLLEVKPFTPFAVNVSEAVRPPMPEKNNVGIPLRPRVTSSARRTALGWSKRSTGKSSSKEQKENISQGTLTTPSESLRLSRPRPRGRPTPARAPVPLRG